jgi:hypothetical protein
MAALVSVSPPRITVSTTPSSRLGAWRSSQRALRNAVRTQPCWIGCGIGPALALPLPKLFSALFGLGPQGPLIAIDVCVVVAIASLLATYIPACRAAATDPIAALRYECPTDVIWPHLLPRRARVVMRTLPRAPCISPAGERFGAFFVWLVLEQHRGELLRRSEVSRVLRKRVNAPRIHALQRSRRAP